ncbi:hypothetical protein GCM10023085_65420 [Actinomadura viridis]|uniref:Uncharacterized protein n=1 Tax=Actinomadura viridis TaxID=58110 RepID=A0A931DSA6_9ACTN|nr:hypothetical protein [Actinomadura viridis]MBG6093042.1 hypothetical protein [Actinomadura viridis]
MRHVLVRARAGIPPGRVEDLTSDDGAPLDRDSLVAAGQALSWRSTFTCGPLTAVPLDGTTALIIGPGGTDPEPWQDPEPWHDRFARGLAHRMAGELTIASVTAGLLGEAVSRELGEDASLLGSAIEGLAGLLTDLDGARAPDDIADLIVADTVRTHAALLGRPARQQVSARRRGDFTVHTVRSVSGDLARPDLEKARTRVGMPWPTGARNGIGADLGLARWRAVMQARSHQMWCRLEGENALVTDLWLRNAQEPRE